MREAESNTEFSPEFKFFSTKPWLWINVLSLDAPIVALLWQIFFFKQFHLELHWIDSFILISSVWLVYVADRWLDGFQIGKNDAKTARHRFYMRYRLSTVLSFVLVLIVTTWLAFERLDFVSIRNGALILCLVGAYFANNHLIKFWQRFFPKEIFIAVIFSLGTGLFVFSKIGLLKLLIPMGIFAILCFLNCCLIAKWEVEQDEAQNQKSIISDYPQMGRYIKAALMGIFVITLLVVWFYPSASCVDIWRASGVSALILFWLDTVQLHLDREDLRLFADVALMTPLLFLG
jgi:hypothetical protein